LEINDNKNLEKNSNRHSFYPIWITVSKKIGASFLKFLRILKTDVARWPPKMTPLKGLCGRVFSQGLVSVGRRFDGGRSDQMAEDNPGERPRKINVDDSIPQPA
jgi:hypothetical protein